MDIWEDIKRTFKQGSALTRLIYINLGLFLVAKIIGVVFYLAGQYNPLMVWLSLPSGIKNLALQPWTIITYMFYHQGFIHLLFNILGLYWFGKLFLYRFEGRKLISVYLMGGIAGGLLYVISYNLFPVFQGVNGLLMGASAAVIAILVATSVYDPQHEIYLFFVGKFPLKYVAIFYVILSVIGISSSNPGGNIAHLGGALWGWFYIAQLRKGKDYGNGIVELIDKIAAIFKPNKKMKVTYKQPPRDDHEYARMKHNQQEEVNRILEKIAKKGYDSLTKSEKDLLFKQGEK